MNTYNNCSEIPVFNFYEIVNTNDYRYLICKYKADSKLKISNNKKVKLQNLFKDIVIEYLELTNNLKAVNNAAKKWLVAKLKFKSSTASSILEIYSVNNDIEALKLLNDLGFTIDVEKDINEQISIIIRDIKAIKNKINIFSSQLKNSEKNENEDVKINLDLDAWNLEQALDLKYMIDIKTTTLSRWVNMWNSVKRKK